MSETLRPCPFCGAPAEMEPWHGGAPTKQLISCSSDVCDATPSVTGETPEGAARRWNRRVISEPGLYEVRDDGTARRMEVDEAVERVARVVLWKAMGFQYTGDRLTDDSNPRGVRATKTARAVLRALTGDER